MRNLDDLGFSREKQRVLPGNAAGAQCMHADFTPLTRGFPLPSVDDMTVQALPASPGDRFREQQRGAGRSFPLAPVMRFDDLNIPFAQGGRELAHQPGDERNPLAQVARPMHRHDRGGGFEGRNFGRSKPGYAT